ncbi:MAG: hypothetical protein LBS77_05450 [Desulfovibrio sp.]|jgi:AsmA protein|nr:hypothetical protein [Desulfovibrio sp.]
MAKVTPFRGLRLLLYVGAAFLFVAAFFLTLAFFYLRNNVAAITREHLDKLTRDTSLTVSVQRVDIDFWPVPVLIVGDFSLESKDWLFSATTVKLHLAPAALLRGAFTMRGLELERPVLRAGSLDVLRNVAAILPSLSDDGGSPPQNIHLSVKNGQAILAENDAESPLLTDLHLTADMTTANGDRGQCTIRLNGTFYKDAVPLPFFLGGKVLVYDRGGSRGDIYRVDVKDMALRLDNDAVVLDVELTLPEPRRTPHADDTDADPRIIIAPYAPLPAPKVDPEAGDKTGREVGPDAQSRPAEDSGDSFKLRGNLQIQRVSLSRWLGFGRIITPGLQWALNEVTDAVMDFSLDKKGLSVSSIVAHVSGARFTGTGGVKSWVEPVVVLDLKTDRLNLITALPEATGRLPDPPPFVHGTLTPVPDTILKPDETGVSYYIRLGAQILDYGPLLLTDAKVIIEEGKLDEAGRPDTLLTAAAYLYDGSIMAQAVFGGDVQHPYAISAHFRDVNGEELASALSVLPVQSGRMRADVNIKSQGRSLEEFLEKLTGEVEVGVSHGVLRRISAQKNAHKTSPDKSHSQSKIMDFTGLTLDLNLHSAVFDHEKSRLGLNGHWSSVLGRTDYSLRAELAGMLYFGGQEAGDTLHFQNRPGSLSLQFTGDSAQNALVEIKGNFSCLSDKWQVSVSGGRLSAPGIDAEGDMRFFEDGDSLAYKGTVSTHSLNPARMAGFAGSRNSRFWNSVRTLSLMANVKGNTKEIILDNLRVAMDNIALRGFFSAALGKQPSFEFRFVADELSLDRFFQDSGVKLKNYQNYQPWDLRFLRDTRAKGSLRVGRLKFRQFLLQDAQLPMTLENGRLTIDPVTARIYGGPFFGKSVLHFTQSLRFESTFTAEEADLASISRDIPTSTLLGGKMGFKLSLAGELTGVDPMSKAVNGIWRFAVSRGSYQKLDKNGVPKGSPTFYDMVQASGDIRAGVARGNDFTLHDKDIAMNGGGYVDFNTNILDCSFVINMKNLPDIPVRLHGNFKDSKITVNVGKVILNTLGGISKGVFDILGDVVQGAWKFIH